MNVCIGYLEHDRLLLIGVCLQGDLIMERVLIMGYTKMRGRLQVSRTFFICVCSRGEHILTGKCLYPEETTRSPATLVALGQV